MIINWHDWCGNGNNIGTLFLQQIDQVSVFLFLWQSLVQVAANWRFVWHSGPLSKAQRRSGFRPSCRNVHGAASVTIGPKPPFASWPSAAVQLHQTDHSSILQHFRRVEVGRADKATMVRIPEHPAGHSDNIRPPKPVYPATLV
jgi:hypothetical protein